MLVLPSACTFACTGGRERIFIGTPVPGCDSYMHVKQQCTISREDTSWNPGGGEGNLDVVWLGSLCSAGTEQTHCSDAFPRRKHLSSALPQPGEKHLRASA